jgi:hypothetical protein
MALFELKELKGFLTNIDSPDIPSDFASEMRGGYSNQDGAIFTRDFGTLNRITGCPVPIRPNAFKVITGAVTHGGLIQITCTGHGYSNLDVVYIDEVVGVLAANGKWTITWIDANTFDLVGSTFSGTYTSGGIASKTPITIARDFIFTDTTTGTEYYGIVGLDSSNNMRIYVYDSGWIELSRSFGALVNDTIGATDTQFDFDTLTEAGVAYTNANDEYNNWVVVNTSKSNQTVFITDSSTTGAAAGNLVVDTIVGSSGLGWANNDVLNIYRFPCFKFNYTYANGATPLVNFLAVEAQRKMAILYTDSSTIPVARQPIQIMRRPARNYFNTTGTQAVAQIIIAAPNTDDQVTIVAGTGVYDFFYNNTDPTGYTFSSADDLALQLTNITSAAWVNAAGTITATALSGGTAANSFYIVSYSDRIKASNVSLGATSGGGTRNFEGGADSSGYTRVLTEGWYCESEFGMLNPFYIARGSTLAPVNNSAFPTFTDNLYDKTSGRNWGSVCGTLTNYAAVETRTQLRAYITVSYDNYQESDPVWQGFIKGNTEDQVNQLKIQLKISFALMNKNITSINFYTAMAKKLVVGAGWADAPADYVLTWRLKTQDITVDSQSAVSWTTGTSTMLSVITVTAQPIVMEDAYYIAAIGNATIFDRLNHIPDITRTYPTPRYAIQLARSQGSMVIIDEDDGTLRRSNQNGDGNNEDDNFPNVTVGGSSGEIKLKDYLLGVGELQGLAYLNGQLHAFKKSEKDIIGIDSGVQASERCDFAAKRSLLVTPKGIFYAGEYAMYLIPSNGGEPDVLNGAWQNLYDGRMTIASSVTSKITSAYRSAIVSAYADYNNAIWSVIQMNKDGGGTEYVAFVYSFNEKPVSRERVGWYQRKLNIGSDGSVKSFSSKKSNKTLTIAHSAGLLQYPNTLGSFLYQDDVLINGAGTQISQSKGIPTKFKINFGSFYSILNRTIYDKFKLDFVGSSISGTGAFNVKFYANDVLYETKTFPIDSEPVRRGLPPVGALERFAIQIDITEGSESDLKALTVSTLAFDYEKKKYIGNK